MRRTIICLLIAVFAISMASQVFAISTNEYSIDIPSTYIKAAENSFSKVDGTNVNIQIKPFTGDSKSTFTNEFLETFEKNVGEQVVVGIKEEVRNELKKQYGSAISDDKIEQFLNEIKFDGIQKKEISTATKNNYKCVHILSKYSLVDKEYYTDQYLFISNNKAYTLTAAVFKQSDIESPEIKEIINSFTIANYKEPEGKKFKNLDKILETVLGVIFAVIIGSIIDAVRRKKAKKAKENNIEENVVENKKEVETNEPVQPIESENAEANQENRFCPSCGNKVENNAEFCSNCGHKLK